MSGPRTILIADDDERILSTLSRNLKLEGYHVVTTADGREAAAFYAQQHTDIALIDIRMPGVDGFEVLKAIRERDATAEVILVTGHGDVQMAIDALRMGASDFIPKPVEQKTLDAALSRAESRIRFKEELRAARAEREQYATDLEARNRELRLAQARLVREENLSFLGSLAIALAHEINNPLTPIRIRASATRQMVHDPVIQKYMDSIVEGVDRISGVIQRILLLDIPGSSLGDVECVDVNAIIGTLLDTANAQKLLNQCDLVLDLDPNLPPLEADADRLRQALLNVVLNAAEAMQANPPHQPQVLHIRTSCPPPPETGTPVIHIECTDTGHGIPENDLERAFDPDYTTKTKDGEMQGLGLGLYVARSVAELHSGQLTLQNRPDQHGVIVTISLPVKNGEKGE